VEAIDGGDEPSLDRRFLVEEKKAGE